MYRNFFCIIENINGDIVVFDFDWFGVVFVIDSRGKYCFIYMGYFFGLSFELWGICMDVLFYILVCDGSICMI